jgi:hypothetical protein
VNKYQESAEALSSYEHTELDDDEPCCPHPLHWGPIGCATCKREGGPCQAYSPLDQELILGARRNGQSDSWTNHNYMNDAERGGSFGSRF